MNFIYGWALPEVDNWMGAHISPNGDYQAVHWQAALEYVTDFAVAVDGGSHIGTWAKPLSKRFKRVISVEPAVDSFECLVWNMRQQGCSNVELKNVALGATPGKVTMYLEGRAAESANTGARFVRPGGKIPVETIDGWKLPTLGFLKLDVEGSEVAALRGARGTIARCRPIILFEDKGLWKRYYGEHRLAVQRLLTAFGYKFLQRVSMDEIWGPT